jgi:hypothetical protein
MLAHDSLTEICKRDDITEGHCALARRKPRRKPQPLLEQRTWLKVAIANLPALLIFQGRAVSFNVTVRSGRGGGCRPRSVFTRYLPLVAKLMASGT